MTDSMREAFEAWIEAPDNGYKDQASIYWSAFASGAKHARATAKADAKYLDVVERLVEALESAKINLNDFRGCIYDRDDDDIKTQEKIAEALALAAPLLEKREEV